MSQHEEQSGMSPLQHHLPAEFHSMLHSQDPDKLARLFVMGERAGDLLSILKPRNKISLLLPKQAATQDEGEEDNNEEGIYEDNNADAIDENRVEVSKELAAGIRELFGKISKGSAINDPALKDAPKTTEIYKALREYLSVLERISSEELVTEDPELADILKKTIDHLSGNLQGDDRLVSNAITFNYLSDSSDHEDIKKKLTLELFPFNENPFEIGAVAPVVEEEKDEDEEGNKKPELTPEQKQQVQDRLSKKNKFHPKNISSKDFTNDEDLQANVSSFAQLAHALGIDDKIKEEHDAEGHVIGTSVVRPEKTDILVHKLAEDVEKAVPEWEASTNDAREKLEQGLQKGLSIISGASFARNLNESPHELLSNMVNYMADSHNMHALLQEYRQQGHIRGSDEELSSKPYKSYKVQHHLWLGLPHPNDDNYSAESREELAAMSQDLQDYVISNQALYASSLAKGEIPHPTGDIEILITSSPTISGSAAMADAVVAKIIRIGNKRYSSTDTSGNPTEDYSPSKNPEKVYDSALTAKKASLSSHSITTNITAAAKDLLNDYERLDRVMTAPTEDNLTELFTKWYAVTALYGKGEHVPEDLVQVYAELFDKTGTRGSREHEEIINAFLSWVSSPGKNLILPQVGSLDMVHWANKLGRSISSAFKTRASKNAHILLKFIVDKSKNVVESTKEVMEALPHIMSEDMMVKGQLEYPELRQAIHESTSGTMDRLKVHDALRNVFGEVGKKGWEVIANDYAHNPSENEIVSAIVRLGSILVESRDPNKVAIGSSLVNNPGPRAEELANIVKGSLLRNLDNGKITSNVILTFENMFGHGGKLLHTSKNKSKITGLPPGKGDGENRNLLYVKGNWDHNKREAPTNVKVGQTYRLVYDPQWQERLYDKAKKIKDTKDKDPKDVAKEEAAKETGKSGRMAGYLFAIKGNAPVVHVADRRLGMNEIPRFLEFVAKRYTAVKLQGGSYAGRRVSPDLMDDEGNSTNLINNLPEDYINGFLARADWDANSGIKKALRGKSYKVIRETLKSLKDNKLLELAEAKKHGSYQVNSDGSITKRPSRVNSELSDEMLESGPSSSEVTLSELNKFITRLTLKLPKVTKKDLAGKKIQDIMALLSTSQQVASIFLEDALDPEMNIGKTNAITSKTSRKQYNNADFDHLAWFDGALRTVMKSLDVEGIVDQVSDETRKGTYTSGNPATSLIAKMVDHANNSLRNKPKMEEFLEKWKESAQKWDSGDHPVKFDDMFKVAVDTSIKTDINTKAKLLEFFNVIYDVSSGGTSVQGYPGFSNLFQVENSSTGSTLAFVKDAKNNVPAKVDDLKDLANSLVNDPDLGSAILKHLDDMGVTGKYMPHKAYVYVVKKDADPAQISNFIRENSAHGQVGKMLLAYGGKEATFSVASLVKEIKRKEKKPGVVDPVTGEDETDKPRWKTQVRDGFDAMCKALAKVSGGLKALKNAHGGIINSIEHAIEQEAAMKNLGDPTALFRGFVVKCLSNIKTLKQNQDKRESAKGGTGAVKKDYDSLATQNAYIGDHLPNMFLSEVHSNVNRKRLIEILKETLTAKNHQDKELKLTDATLQKYRDGLTQFLSSPKIAELAGS